MALTIEDVSNYGTALVAYENAVRGKRHYRQVKVFDKNKRENFLQLQKDFQDGTYRTSGYILKTINDGRKEREIAKTVLFRDRVAQWMIAWELIPYLMNHYFSPHSHAAMKGRGIHSALEETRKYLADPEVRYCLKLDIQKFFPSVDRELLKIQIRRIFRHDKQLAEIVCRIIDDAPKTGIPIGNLLSQYLANIVLTPLDRWLDAQGIQYVRYMDDIVVFAATKEELRRIHLDIEWFLMSRLNLSLKPNWQIFPVERGIDFVGYRIYTDRVMLRKSTFRKLRRCCFKILRNVKARGFMTMREKGELFGRIGWLAYCTQGDIDYIYYTYFAPVLKAAGMKLTKKLKRKLWKQQKESDTRLERSQQTQLSMKAISGSISSPT